MLREVGAFKLSASMTFEQQSVFPMTIATAAIALFVILGIPQALARGDDTAQKPSSALLVWGRGIICWGVGGTKHGLDCLRDGEPAVSGLAETAWRGGGVGSPRCERREVCRGGQGTRQSIELAFQSAKARHCGGCAQQRTVPWWPEGQLASIM